MKLVSRLVALAVLLCATTAFAASFDGTYSFVSRTKAGQPDLAGATGTMKITNNVMYRDYILPDGKTKKFYEGTMTTDPKDPNLITVKFTKAYKPEYVGNEHKNKMVLTNNTLTMTSDDGQFKEVWNKK